MGLSRRTCLGGLCAAALSPLLANPGQQLEVDRLLGRLRSAVWNREHQLYRVDAALTALGSPLHWFRDIGHGFLTFDELPGATAFRFGATSNPAKARGFDRTGFIEEACVDQEFASFGFITAGHDVPGGSPASGFTAMDLYARGEQCWFKRAGLSPGDASPRSLDRLIGVIRSAFPSAVGAHSQVRLGGPRPTFLHALLQAVHSPGEESRCTYVYNAKQFDLRLERHRDPRLADGFAAKRLTSRPDAVRRYEGYISADDGRQWNFRFWREDGTPSRLPLRIEFQPKPLLRLSLERSS